jgi:hypothetical protein
VAELADALASGASKGNLVEVRVLSSALRSVSSELLFLFRLRIAQTGFFCAKFVPSRSRKRGMMASSNRHVVQTENCAQVVTVTTEKWAI